jgi:hypothetical protein
MSKKLKASGLVLLVVCAFGAVTASAQAAPKFTVSGITSGKEAIAEAAVPNGALILTVPGQLRITCSALRIKHGSITVGTDEGAVEALDFGGCSVDNNAGTAVPNCTVHDSLTGFVGGTIRTNPMTATLVNIGEEGYVTFKPTGTTFATIEIESTGQPCALEGTFAVSGTSISTVEAPKAGILATTVSLVWSEAIQKAGGDKLLFGVKEAFLDGTVGLRLASDRSWGYDL